MKRRTAAFILAGVLLMALGLRLYHLGKYTYWFDEAIIALDRWGLPGLHSPAKLFDADFLLKNFDYLKFAYSCGIINPWGSVFGTTESSLRFTSVLFGIMGVYLLYRFSRLNFDRPVSLAAAVLLAVSPLHIYYSQELKTNALVSFIWILGLYLFIKAVKTGKSRYWVYYGLSQTLQIYLLYTGVLFLIPPLVFFLIHIRRYRHLFRAFVLTHICIAVLLLPVFLTLYPNLQFIMHHPVDPVFSEFPNWAGGHIGFKYLIALVKNFSLGYQADYASVLVKKSVLIFVFVFLIGSLRLFKDRWGKLVLFCIYIPVAVIFLVAQFKSFYIDRYLFPVLPLYLLALANAIQILRKKTFIVLALLCVAALSLSGLGRYYANALPQDREMFIGVGQKQNIRPIIDTLMREYNPGDTIMHVCKNTVFPLKFYLRQKRAESSLIREADRGTVIFFSDFAGKSGLFSVSYDRLHPVSFIPQDYKPVAEDSFEAGRIWLVFSDFVFPDPGDPRYKLLDEITLRGYHQVKAGVSEGVNVYLFARNN